jgi:hypothetical protein
MNDRAQGADQQLTGRYLAGQLTADEARNFEEAMLQRPELLAEVELARTVKLGLRTLRERGELESLVRARHGTARRYLATAAAVALAVVGYWWLANQRAPVMLASSLSELGAHASTASVSGEYLVARIRGSESLSLEATFARPVIVLRVLLPLASEGQLQRVELLRGDDRVGSLDATRRGDYLQLFLDSSNLEPGDYELRVSAADGGSPPSAYRLRFTRKDP